MDQSHIAFLDVKMYCTKEMNAPNEFCKTEGYYGSVLIADLRSCSPSLGRHFSDILVLSGSSCSGILWTGAVVLCIGSPLFSKTLTRYTHDKVGLRLLCDSLNTKHECYM